MLKLRKAVPIILMVTLLVTLGIGWTGTAVAQKPVEETSLSKQRDSEKQLQWGPTV